MPKCKECGWNHPPVSGPCPAARIQKIATSEKGKTITNFISSLTNHLNESDSWEDKINMIKQLLKIG